MEGERGKERVGGIEIQGCEDSWRAEERVRKREGCRDE